MIKTKSIRAPAAASDGMRLLVMRLWPRAYSNGRLRLTEWRRDLAPSKALLRDWCVKTISWDRYVDRYLNEMKSQQDAIARLAELAKTTTITLLCIEHEGDPHCHRHLLKNLIEQAMRGQQTLR